MKKVIEDTCGHWSVRLRLIFDGRLPNTDWKKPPWVGLGGPGAISQLEMSVEADDGYHPEMATGDVPNWYYMLGIPQKVAPWFGFPGVTARELREHSRTCCTTVRGCLSVLHEA